MTFNIPNLITTTSMCFGLYAAKLFMDGNIEATVVALTIALLLDGMDGYSARLLKQTTSFGALFDVFSDFSTFGVIVPFIIYSLSLKNIQFGWLIVGIYVLLTAIKQALFINNEENNNLLYFRGVPTPMAAALALSPLILQLEGIQLPNISYAISTSISTLLAISNIPTPSIKKLPVPYIILLFLVPFCLAPWKTILVSIASYVALMLFWPQLVQHASKAQ